MSAAEYRVDNDVAVIVLNDPGSLNALSTQMIEDLSKAIASAKADPDVASIVLTGTGRGFCSGGNLAQDSLADDVVSSMKQRLNPMLLEIAQMPKPVVAAVNGIASGAGVGLALVADIVVAAESAKFILGFVKVGLVLDAGTSKLVAERVGPARALMLALSGAPVTAAQAAEWGLIWRVVDDISLPMEALQLAQRLASGPSHTMQSIKMQLARARDLSLADTLYLEAELQAEAVRSQEFAEGVRAFREKRSPRFRAYNAAN